MNFIHPQWPAPSWVRAYTTTRVFGDLKLPNNRLKLQQNFNLPYEPIWLTQTHSDRVLKAEPTSLSPFDADGVWTQTPGLACTVFTGDCLPILLTDERGTFVCALHCGWKGILAGVIESGLKAVQQNTSHPLLAWFGPAICQKSFEVGEEVRQQFMAQDVLAYAAFIPSINPGKWYADIYELAKNRLHACGVRAIFGGGHCTYLETDAFFSHRRRETGRMASFIWLENA